MRLRHRHWSGAANLQVGGVFAVVALAVACSTNSGRSVPSSPALALSPDTVRLRISGATNAGAGVVASGDRVAVTWAATSGDHTNVYAAMSDDGGGTFAAPVRVNDVDGDARMSGEQAPRVALENGLVVGWISRSGRAIQHSHCSIGRPWAVVHSGASHPCHRPRRNARVAVVHDG